MKKFYFSPSGYVPGSGELVALFCAGLVVLGVVVFALSDLVSTPPVPENLVLRSASITQPLIVSKAQADLYFDVSFNEGRHKCRLELSYRDVKHLDIFKGKKIWVAMDANNSGLFVWEVYDDGFKLLVGRQQIEGARRYIDFGNCLAAFLFGLSFVHFLYLFVLGVWNRCFYRRTG